jgi:HEAT repeat protein
MLTLAPPKERVVHIAWYNTIVGLVSALGPVAGGLISEGIGGGPSGAGIALPFGLRPFTGFAAVQLAALLSMAVAVLVLRGVREGRERPVAGLVGQMASTGLFRTYASLQDLKRQSGDPRVARALRRIDGDEGELVIREVIEHLDDPSPETREEAVRALSRIRTEESRQALAALLGDSAADPSSDLRLEAARALARLGDPASIQALEAAMASEDPALRAACAWAIASLDRRTGGSRLAELLEGEGDDRVHEAAALGASSFASVDDEGDEALAEAALEICSRLASTGNRALRIQYAIGLANILGNAGSFTRFVAGDAFSLAANRSLLAHALTRRVSAILDRPDLADRGPPGLLDGLASALEAGDGRRSLAVLIEAHQMLVESLFGTFGDEGELQAILSRADQRLAAWHAIAKSLSSGSLHLDDKASLLLALVGAWYLGSE